MLFLLFALACSTSAPPEREQEAPDPVKAADHAVVIVIDTVRGDVMEEAVTPTWDALAGRGQVVERAWPTSTWTVPSVISLFTGTFVRTHGWDLPTGDMTHRPSLPQIPTLAEVLKAEGFRTEGLYSNGYLASELGFSRGFDTWRRASDRSMPRDLRRLVEGWEEGDRHFLYLHLLGAHSGLNPSEEARARHGLSDDWFTEQPGFLIGRAKRGREEGVREAYRSSYVAVVEDTDRRVGELLSALEPVLDSTLVVLLADHGEELGERSAYGHGWSVAEALTHIPMVIAGPGIEPGTRRTATLAEVPDILTDSLGIAHDWPVQTPYEGPLVSERHGKLAVLLGGEVKGEWYGQQLKTFDLKRDPVAPTTLDPEPLEAALSAWKEQTPEGPDLTTGVSLNESTLEAIRALGYID